MRAQPRPQAGSRRLAFLLAIVLVPPALALVWLGRTLLEEDRRLLAERRTERRDAAAEVLTRALFQSTSEAGRWLVEGDLPEGAARASWSAAGVEVLPAGRAQWLPDPVHPLEAASEPFAASERLEFTNSGDRGLASYRALTSSTDPSVRAGALLRVARVERQRGRPAAAIGAYRDLARIEGIAVNGTPVGLIARRMICELLQETGQQETLAVEADALRRDLLSGRWTLDRASWELAADDVTQWSGPIVPSGFERQVSLAADWLAERRSELPSSGRRVVTLENGPVTVVWQSNPVDFQAVILGRAVIEGWVQAALARDLPLPVSAVLRTSDGIEIAGGVQDLADTTVVLPSDSGLPWTLVVGPSGNVADDLVVGSRTRLLVTGLGALALLFSGSGYLLWRVVAQELAVARLQTDFVAAVSHEFRTPLTSLRHISDLLQETDEMPAGRRQSLYATLSQSTSRLYRLVESLLDFARMEDGRRPWHRASIDASTLLSDVVAAFRGEHPSAAIEVDLPPPGSVAIDVDGAALTHAIWNLLDNAVKYSPDGGTIFVSVARDAGGTQIAVRDQGLGIAPTEQREIFGRFVRGQSAEVRGTGGTGLGLAMVAHVVAGHGGRVDLVSDVGKGSTFTIVLPASSTVDLPAADAADHEREVRSAS